MPFDGLPESVVTDMLRLRIARDGIKRAWGQGPFGAPGAEKHCLVGWLLEATEWDEAETVRLAVDYVYPALPEKAQKPDARMISVWQYNDSHTRTHAQVLRLMDRAIELAEG
jgi:hypothetical protein